ncbi:MAG: hypothetical protein Q8L23_02120 [Caulobacter sp.]|nr:hypothetical protein [Caulobacter sp.]
MLTEIDRILLATPDAVGSAMPWRDLLGAEFVGRDRLASLGAQRMTLRVGTTDIEFLEPDGTGVVADELARRGRAHLFAAGAASEDAAGVARHAATQGALCQDADGRHYIQIAIEGAPIRFVVSPAEERQAAGNVEFLYEATVLAADQAAAVDLIARTFNLDPAVFSTITSEAFGYTGVLTLFHPDRLHRFEVITPIDMAKTMGRYYGREGASYYMAFAESARMPLIERLAKEAGAGITIDRPEQRDPALTADQLWLHPQTLGGMMLGVSRPTMAWRWSGKPERVEAI